MLCCFVQTSTLVYTKSHLDYVTEACADVADLSGSLKGFRIVSVPENCRWANFQLEPVEKENLKGKKLERIQKVFNDRNEIHDQLAPLEIHDQLAPLEIHDQLAPLKIHAYANKFQTIKSNSAPVFQRMSMSKETNGDRNTYAKNLSKLTKTLKNKTSCSHVPTCLEQTSNGSRPTRQNASKK